MTLLPKTTDTATTHHRREQLLAGWERVSKTARQLQSRHQAKRKDNATGRRNDGGQRGKQGGGGEANEEKAQETSNDVFWAVSKFFFSFSFRYFITNELFRY